MPERLTKRQEECLRLSATMTDKEIARALGISENTVDKHFREILRKFGVNTPKAALRLLASDATYATGAIPAAVAPGPVRDVDAGRLKSRGGDKVAKRIDEGLVRQDGKVLYVVDDDIPVMLIEGSIEL